MIVPPEARLYPFAESVTHDGGGNGTEAVSVVEVDFKAELRRCVVALLSGLYCQPVNRGFRERA